jgi:protein gp37
MSKGSKIEWTETTWSTVTGCDAISDGCKNCYAKRMSERLCLMGQEKYKNGFEVITHPALLEQPFAWKKPTTIFVNSMSDTFHPDVSDDFIYRLFAVMAATPQHTYQLLTKRSQRLECLDRQLCWRRNIWMGVSVENGDCTDRMHDLLSTGDHVKFISFEPLLGPIDKGHLDMLQEFDMVIVGGETGPGARPMNPNWARAIRDHCLALSVPFFFKHAGGARKTEEGYLLDGKEWHQMPGGKK